MTEANCPVCIKFHEFFVGFFFQEPEHRVNLPDSSNNFENISVLCEFVVTFLQQLLSLCELFAHQPLVARCYVCDNRVNDDLVGREPYLREQALDLFHIYLLGRVILLAHNLLGL